MTAITPPTRSVFETSPEKLRPFLEGLAARVSGGSNWMVRKKTVCDLLLGLDAFFALPAAERSALMADGGASPDIAEAEGKAEGGPEDFRKVLPLYVGAILEGMRETVIASRNRRRSICCRSIRNIRRRRRPGCWPTRATGSRCAG